MLRYTPEVRARVRNLRRRQTDAELKLWRHLRARQINMAKFRRQHPIGQFVVDFCCPEHRLVVELDGGHHATQAQEDRRRTEIIAQHGFHVLRFWDDEVLKNTEAVLEVIVSVMQDPHPNPLPERERENSK
ncbi:MAG: endonuclease domain-containing protein [Gammaproteobacteria bacterium]|nr:endonuclease domain-containing protein [Gammaproteobacteria bacterium]